MNKSEVTDDSIAVSKIYHSGASGNKRVNIAKENDSKYMNAIRPYVKERKISKRQSNKNIIASIPLDSAKSKKKSQTSSRKMFEQSGSKNISDAYSELMALKADYKNLKNSYNHLAKENADLTERTQREASDCDYFKRELELVRKQNEKQSKNVHFLEQEIERIKKECFRLLESEKFKNKKLEETIQQKQLMIAYLRSQLAVLHGDSPNTAFFFQHTTPNFGSSTDPSGKVFLLQNQEQISSLSKISASNQLEEEIEINLPRQMPKDHHKGPEEHISGIKKPKRQYVFSNQEDSLSFSMAKSKEELDSLMSISEPTVLTFTKKDVYVCEDEFSNEGDGGTSSFTGEEELLTFENRYGNSKIVDSTPNTSKIRPSEGGNGNKRGSKQKIKEKKLQICTDELGMQNEKDLSVIKKQNIKLNSKLSKGKKARTKRKSEEGPTINMRR